MRFRLARSRPLELASLRTRSCSLAERRSERWSEAFLAEVIAGRDDTLMNMHAYLQTPAPGVSIPAGECE